MTLSHLTEDFENDRVSVTTRLNTGGRYNSPKFTKPRFFISGENAPDMERPPYDTYDEQGNRSTEFDAAWRKYNRLEVKNMKKVMLEGLAAVGVDTAKIKLRFDRHAGCTCSCSPGFVLDHDAEGQIVRGTLVFISKL